MINALYGSSEAPIIILYLMISLRKNLKFDFMEL